MLRRDSTNLLSSDTDDGIGSQGDVGFSQQTGALLHSDQNSGDHYSNLSDHFCNMSDQNHQYKKSVKILFYAYPLSHCS